MRNLLFALVLFGATVIFGCGNSASRRSDSPSSETASTPATVTSTPRKSVPKIVAFGDSLTAGYGLPVAQSYPSLLQQKLDADGFEYEVVNAGVSGDTSAGGVRRIDWSLEGDVRVVIVELGANDFLRGQPIAETKKNLSQIIERAKSRKAQVLLAGMYTPTSAGAQYEREIRDAFETLAREHSVVLIPFFLENVAGIEKLNQQDGVHPNTEGTKIVADTVYKYLRPMLEKAADGR